MSIGTVIDNEVEAVETFFGSIASRISAFFTYFVNRLKEPSTYATITAVLGSVIAFIPDGTVKLALMAVGGASAMLGIWLRERGTAPIPPVPTTGA